MDHTIRLWAVRDDGRIFDYNNEDWGLLKIKGFDFSEIETFTSAKGVGDGDIITGQRRKSREMSIEARPRNRENVDTQRAQAIAFHSTRHSYDVHIIYLGVHRVAKKCRVITPAFPTGNVYRTENLSMVFLSGDPDLYSEAAVDEYMVERAARWAVTRSYLPGTKLLFATETPVSDRVIIYEGTNPAPVRIDINATGYCKDFTVSIGGISCTINAELNDGDLIQINSEQAFATLNGKLISYAGTGNFDMRQFRIFNGENKVVIKAAQGDAFTTKIVYTGRYDGV